MLFFIWFTCKEYSINHFYSRLGLSTRFVVSACIRFYSICVFCWFKGFYCDNIRIICVKVICVMVSLRTSPIGKGSLFGRILGRYVCAITFVQWGHVMIVMRG